MIRAYVLVRKHVSDFSISKMGRRKATSTKRKPKVQLEDSKKVDSKLCVEFSSQIISILIAKGY
jgi:hypothetical protein